MKDTAGLMCNSFQQVVKGGQNKLNIDYNNAVQNYVCSQQCPCYEGPNKENLDLWTKIGESEFNVWNRTKVTNSNNKAFTPIVFTPKKEASYGSWLECYNKLLKPTVNTDSKLKAVKDFIDKGGLEFMQDAEEKLRCAGFCDRALFYVTLDISYGRPEKDCLTSSIESLQGSTKGAGVIAIITAIVLFIAFSFSFPLCTGFNKDE